MKSLNTHYRVNKGLSLVETLVSMAILVILLSLAAPSYKSSIESNRRTTYANQLLEDLTLARSEAIKRNTTVTVCPSSNGTNCSGTEDWVAGWMVFVDNSPINHVVDPGEPILRVHEALTLPPGWYAKSNGINNFATFNPTGTITNALSICIMMNLDNCKATDFKNESQYSAVVLYQAGRMRIESK